MARTSYLYKRDEGMLYHSHPQALPPYTVQQHPAHVNHRASTDLHAQHESYDVYLADWSRQNYDLNASQKQWLINKARHGNQRGYVPTYSQVFDSPAPQPASPAPAPAPAPQPAPAPVEHPKTDAPGPSHRVEIEEVVPDPIAEPGSLEERVFLLEEMAINTLEPLDGRLQTIETRIASEERAGLETKRYAQAISDDLRSAVTRLNEDMRKLDISDQLKPIEARVKQLEEAARRQVTFNIERNGETYKFDKVQHEKFELLLKLVTALSPNRRNIWIAGPAGGGKTSAAENLAEMLGLKFEYIGAIDTPYKLSGYMTATGTYISTAFRRIYEFGGVILLDEVDGSSPGALLEINAALANSSASFPDGMVKRHADCIVICAANTWGLGGDGNYVGRAKLDAAFLDRFVKIVWNYDETLERAIAGAPHDWIDVVQATRRLVFTHKAQFVVGPRASILGCELLRAGMKAEEGAEAVFGSYRANNDWSKVGKPIEDYVAYYDAPKPEPTPAPASPSEPSPLDNIDFSQVKVFGVD
jgi:cobaltochelatase CobS